MRCLFASCLGLILFMVCFQARAAPVDGHGLSATAFALRQIADGNAVVNFDDNCPGNPTPGLAEEVKGPPAQNWSAAWQAPCRTVNGTDLVKILKKATALGSVKMEGVNLVKTPGDKDQRIYLYSIKLPIFFQIFYSHIADSLYLDNANFKEVDIEHTDFANAFSTDNMTLDDDFKLDTDHFTKLANLKEMSIGDYLLLSALDGGDELQVNGASVRGYVFLQYKLQFQRIDLSDSVVGKSFELYEIAGTSPLDCQRCTAETLAVDLGSYPPPNFEGDVDFSGSKFNNDLQIYDTGLSGYVNLENVDAANIDISHSIFKNKLLLRYAKVSGIVRFDRVNLPSLDLSDASIGKALDISNIDASYWAPSGGKLDVSNTSTGAFTDCAAAWPEVLDLDGFTYSGIGISADALNGNNDVTEDSKDQPISCAHINGTGSKKGWLRFLSRNQDETGGFNPQPYSYLAKYFFDQGNYQYANEILFQSRKNTMANAWHTSDYPTAIGLGFLWIFAGFGIGGRAVGHLAGTIAVSVFVAWVVLTRSEQARKKGGIWCFGACVARLLPIVKLLKEFDDYFDEPDKPTTKHAGWQKLAVFDEPDQQHPKLTGWQKVSFEEPRQGPPKLAGWQKVFFSLYALWGWIIGFLLVAVLSGVTQAP